MAANTTSNVITGLSVGVTYYFRLQGLASGDTSDWSEVKSATTFVPAPSCMVATTINTTSITADWCDVGVATSYRLEYDDNSGFTSPTSWSPNPTSSVQAVTGLIPGKAYYFRAYALVGTTESLSASPSDTATTTISNPSSVNISSSVPGAVRAYSSGDWIYWPSGYSQSGNWYYAVGSASGSCASGTTRQFRFGSNYTSPTTFRGWTGWTTETKRYMIEPNSPYGIRFQVQARCVGSAVTSGTVSDTSSYAY